MILSLCDFMGLDIKRDVAVLSENSMMQSQEDLAIPTCLQTFIYLDKMSKETGLAGTLLHSGFKLSFTLLVIQQ